MATNTSFHDYSEAIVVPEKIPAHLESHFTALKRAKRVIKILSMFTRGVETFPYIIQNGAPGKLVLPKQYDFDGFQIRFLPGWGTYFVVLEDGVQISIRTPHGKEEFEEDLKLIGDFIKKYNQLPLHETPYKEPKSSHKGSSYELYVKSHPPLSKRQQAVIAFKKNLYALDRGFVPSAE